MNAEQFIEENYFCLKIDCARDIHTIYQALEDYANEQLRLHGVVKSLPIHELPNCTRVEVIDQKGRSYVNWKPSNKTELSFQDGGKTLKVFITNKP